MAAVSTHKSNRCSMVSSLATSSLLPKQSRPALAGLVGGGAATLLLHPLDLLKTRQAVHCNSEEIAARHRYSSATRAAREIVRHEGGLRGLYSGVGANVLVSGASWGIYFLTYGLIKSNFAGDALGAREQLLSALGAGLVTTVVANPLSVVRTRLVMQPVAESKSSSSVGRLVANMARTEGLRGMYKGLAPGLLGVSHGAIQLLVYEQIKGKICAEGRKPTTQETLAACSLSKVAAALLTYPCQNLRACQQASTSSSSTKITSLIRRAGLRGMYRGMAPYLLHVVPNVCLVFLVYEAVVGNS